MEEYNQSFIKEIEKIHDKENESLNKRLDKIDEEFTKKNSS